MKLLLMLVLLAIPQKTGKFTVVTQDRQPNGDWYVEPIYTPIMVFRPLNAVAKGTVRGEALKCTARVDEHDNIYANCDGAEFQMTGFLMQE